MISLSEDEDDLISENKTPSSITNSNLNLNNGDIYLLKQNNDKNFETFNVNDEEYITISHKRAQIMKKKTLFEYLSQIWQCIKSDPKYKRELKKRAHFKGINSVSKCDRIARIIFPTSFFLLNIIYWYGYYDK